jgi:hypothetical protein
MHNKQKLLHQHYQLTYDLQYNKLMNILSFNKITKPIYEGGTTIDLRPRGKWFVQVRRTDGTFRYPFGDMWIDNLFVNRWANGQMGDRAPAGGQGRSWMTGQNIGATTNVTWLNLFYGGQSSIAVGSGTTAVTNSDTALATEVRFDSLPYITGNTISWNQTSGDIVYTIKESFPAETGSVTYNEAAIRLAIGNNSNETINGVAQNSNGIVNRVVFPSGISLSSGEQLILTVAVTLPTLASSAGKTITIAAQNGVDISGVLKCIGSLASMAGGTVTSNGTATLDTSIATLFNTAVTPVALLSTKTAFDTLGTNPTWGTTNQVNGVWASYTNDSRLRDIGFTWGNGVPAANTDFRSILFRNINSAGAYGGYQLLLDAQQTKASTATLALSLRFSV